MPETSNDSPASPQSIALYGPKAVGIGMAASTIGCALGGSLALLMKAEGDSLAGAAAAAGLLLGSWLLAGALAALTGPYRPATAGMAWLALSTARLMILVVAGIALALAAPTMGLGLWLALLLGGLTAVAIDSALALQSFRQHASGQPIAGKDRTASLNPTTGGTR